MDYIREFDIRLEKEMYYAGETVYGVVILDTIENFKLRGTFLLLKTIVQQIAIIRHSTCLCTRVKVCVCVWTLNVYVIIR